jgi:hypothetical protein
VSGELSGVSGKLSVVSDELEVMEKEKVVDSGEMSDERRMVDSEKPVAGTVQKVEQGKVEEKPMGKYKRISLRRKGLLVD